MSNIFTAAEQLIGHTPLLRLVRLEAAHNLNCRLLAKLESFNPGGSAKDRVARAMLDDAEDDEEQEQFLMSWKRDKDEKTKKR